jgi:hypothetical protein
LQLEVREDALEKLDFGQAFFMFNIELIGDDTVLPLKWCARGKVAQVQKAESFDVKMSLAPDSNVHGTFREWLVRNHRARL